MRCGCGGARHERKGRGASVVRDGGEGEVSNAAGKRVTLGACSSRMRHILVLG